MDEQDTLEDVAPAFVDMAHRIVWCIGATVDRTGRPRTRVLHPIWEWSDGALVGWIATSPLSLKARHLERVPELSLTYWAADQDTCTADCTTRWLDDVEGRQAGWDRFLHGPEPVGFDPARVTGWESAASESFGVLELTPHRLRVMPGSVMLTGQGRALTWQA